MRKHSFSRARQVAGIAAAGLYIHPQIRKLFYDVLLDFSDKDQVIYCTHSTQFVDIQKYDNIALVKKNSVDGTKVANCDLSAFAGISADDTKMYKMFQKFDSEISELFFAKNVILVEGVQDRIAITETLIKQEKIKYRTEELEISVIIANGKNNIPSIARVLKAFKINYIVLFDLDIRPGDSPVQSYSKQVSTDKIKLIVEADRIVTFPISLEDSAGTFQNNHFGNTFKAYEHFSTHANISLEIEDIVGEILRKF